MIKGLNFLKRINSWAIYFILTFIVAGIALSSFFLIKHLREKETERIRTLATAMRYLQDNEVDSRLTELAFYVVDENQDLPIIVTDKNKNVLESRGIS